MKLLNLGLATILIVLSAFLCQQIIANSLVNQGDKNDLAELNHIKYGLLSIDQWKSQVTIILEDEINKIYLSKENEQVLRAHIEVLLNTLIDKVDKKIKKKNADSAGGRVTQSFINTFIDLDDIKKGIPDYANAVIHEIKKAKTKRQIKAVLQDQLEQYSEQTFDIPDTPILNRILLRMDCKDVVSARIKLAAEVAARHDLIVKQVLLLIGLSGLLFAAAAFSRTALLPAQAIFLVVSLLTLLIAGVTTPMIDMVATLSQMSLMLLGHPVHFENQVLYFQSKSILDVFWIMITHQDIEMKLVGILLVTFSVVFPVAKLVSSLLYYFDYRHAQHNRAIQFFVMHAGKWSMADVMVVAIFMAYIGFNGIITSQLGHLNSSDQDLVILTTNGTSLQPGYYLFVSYVLLALLLASLLKRSPQAISSVHAPGDTSSSLYNEPCAASDPASVGLPLSTHSNATPINAPSTGPTT